MKRQIKFAICILFGHKHVGDSEGGYCGRCGWGMFSNKYKTMELLNKYKG